MSMLGTTTTTTTSTTTSTTTTTTTSTTSTSTTTTTTSTTNYHKPGQNARVYDPETLKAMGFGGMTDGVAMLTRAKENLMFTMAALSVEQRVALSYDLPEFVEMCSFNGEQCNIDTSQERNCLASRVGDASNFHHATQDMENCYCKQSCKQDLFEVTFSASKWPSGATDAQMDRLGDCEGMSTAECEDYYRLNAAMIEIFYEQLNYEFLQETEGVR
ncbi:unnamed protein product, partial [Mesorhabditis spiculigera]